MGMGNKRDYYEVLGISRDASDKEITSAFRSLARKFHPDKNSEDDAAEKFKEIQEAYAVLSDSNQKQNYDRFGHNSPGGSPFGAGGFQGFDIRYEDLFGGGGLEDLLGSFFGRSSSSGQRNGRNVLARHTIDFAMLMEGGMQEINLKILSKCEDCNGSGGKDSSSVRACNICKGVGQVTQTHQMGPFMQRTVTACPECNGRGNVVKTPCSSCKGAGRTKTPEKIRFNVPPGVESGTRLRIRGKGEHPEYGTGRPGDLLIELTVDNHQWFERQGPDLIMSFPVGYPDLILGRKFSIPHIDNKNLDIVVPSGSNSGETIVIPKRGIPDQRTGFRGDVVVLLKLYVPTKISKSEKKAIDEIRDKLSLDESSVVDALIDDTNERRRNN